MANVKKEELVRLLNIRNVTIANMQDRIDDHLQLSNETRSRHIEAISILENRVKKLEQVIINNAIKEVK